MAFSRSITTTHTKTLISPSTGVEDKVYGADYVSASSHTSTGSVTDAISGGIPYFSSTTAEGSSALLAAGGVVLGGGAGAAPATNTGLTFNTTTLRLTAGSTSSGNTQGWIFGGDGSASQSKIWSAVNVISSTNYALATDNNYVWLNAASGAQVQFRINNVEQVRVDSTGLIVEPFAGTGIRPIWAEASGRLATVATAGANFGPGLPTSLTFVNGICTAAT